MAVSGLYVGILTVPEFAAALAHVAHDFRRRMEPRQGDDRTSAEAGSEEPAERLSAVTHRLACIPVVPRPAAGISSVPVERATPVGGRRTPVPEPPLLRLLKLRPGQTRALRLELIAGESGREVDTGCSLEIRISCDAEQRVFWLDVKPDFAGCVPRSAAIILLQDDGTPTRPLEVADGRRLLEKSIPLELTADMRRIRFRVFTEGAAELPPQMSAEVRLRTSTLPPSGA